MLVGEDYVYQTSTVTDEFGEYCFLGLTPTRHTRYTRTSMTTGSK